MRSICWTAIRPTSPGRRVLTVHGVHGALTTQLTSAAHRFALSNAFGPPLLAMYSVLLKWRMKRVGKLNDANEVPCPLRPACGQNVASARKIAEPSIGWRTSWKLKWRRKSPGKLRDSNETHELLARPRRTIQVLSPLSTAELPDVITEVTALLFWWRMYRVVQH